MPGGIRTPNLLIRSQKLYPVELQALVNFRFSISDFRFEAEKSTIDNRKSKIDMGWPTGLEPATTRTTIWSSTIELRPPSPASGRSDFRFRISFCKGNQASIWHGPRLFSHLRGRLDCNWMPEVYSVDLSSHEQVPIAFSRCFLASFGFWPPPRANRRPERRFSKGLHDRPTGREIGA